MQERLRALTVLWRRALAGPAHAAGCSCFGGFMMPAPSARELEEDVLDYLRHKYAAAEPQVAARLLTREAALRADAACGFADFLSDLAAALPPAARDRLLSDIEATLLSFDPPAAGPSRFACV